MANVVRAPWRKLGQRACWLVGAALIFLGLEGCGDLSDESAVGGINLTNASPSEATPFSDGVYQRLIDKYASSEGESVDYGAWQSSSGDMAALDDFVALIAKFSPDRHPQLFPSSDARRRYWINAYNALVIDSVLDLWPLDSVRDVNVSLTSRIIPGKGFFYDREIVVGGQRTNLLNLEKQILREQQDPRLHFALNCASDSCPVLRASDWSDSDLDRAAVSFVNDPANVVVEPAAVYLSSIFKWYKSDFPRDIYSYLQQYAADELYAQLETAIEQNRPKRYIEYDWSLNADSRNESP